MSSWHPQDLVTDADLTAYEPDILTQFGMSTWEDKRTKALEDWLGPILRTQHFTLDRLRTRYEADAVLGYTGAAYTDFTSASTDATVDDLTLATIFATPASDALYVGSLQPFRGLSIRMLDAVSAVAGTLTVQYWGDAWTALPVANGTTKVLNVPFSGGGSVLWTVPSTWVMRTLNGSVLRYWVKVTVSQVPTAAKASQIGVIRRSSLCAPVALRTLTLIMRAAPSGGPGPWAEKAAWYETEADAALQRALAICGGEFETDDPQTDLISAAEAAQTSEEAGGGWRWERA